MLEALVTQQAAVMAYSNDFLLMTFVCLCAFPLLAPHPRRRRAGARPGRADREAHAAVMD